MFYCYEDYKVAVITRCNVYYVIGFNIKYTALHLCDAVLTGAVELACKNLRGPVIGILVLTAGKTSWVF